MKYLIANWKMNLNREQSLDLAKEYKKKVKGGKEYQIIIAPIALALPEIKKELGRSSIKLSAQNVAAEAVGSFTGEISAAMFKEAGAEYSLVGHSERRHFINETSEMIAKKITRCYEAGLTPILCIGETADEKENNQTEAALVRQLQSALFKVENLVDKELFIAYEPVWAIGTGACLVPAEMAPIYRVVKRTISSMVSDKYYGEKVKLLYGGSVTGERAASFWGLAYLDGLLVGGQSLSVEKVKAILM
ncbi:MAG: triose-phosphate isomerase [Parcubacteria group bacterium]